MSNGYHIPVPSYIHDKGTDKTAEKLHPQNTTKAGKRKYQIDNFPIVTYCFQNWSSV